MEKILEQPTAKATGSEVQFVMRSEPKPKVSAQYLSQLPCTDCRCPIPTIVISPFHFLFQSQGGGPRITSDMAILTNRVGGSKVCLTSGSPIIHPASLIGYLGYNFAHEHAPRLWAICTGGTLTR